MAGGCRWPVATPKCKFSNKDAFGLAFVFVSTYKSTSMIAKKEQSHTLFLSHSSQIGPKGHTSSKSCVA